MAKNIGNTYYVGSKYYVGSMYYVGSVIEKTNHGGAPDAI